MSPPVAVRSTPIPVKPAELYSDPKYQEMDLEISALIRKTLDTKSYPSRELIVANAGHDAGAADVHRKLVLRRWVAVHKLAADGAGGELAGEVVQGGVQAGHDASERTGVHVEALRAGVEEWLSGP